MDVLHITLHIFPPRAATVILTVMISLDAALIALTLFVDCAPSFLVEGVKAKLRVPYTYIARPRRQESAVVHTDEKSVSADEKETL